MQRNKGDTPTFSFKTHFRKRSSATLVLRLHQCVLVILFVVGMVVSFILDIGDLSKHLGVFGHSYDMWMTIDPHLLLFTMLPPLVTGDLVHPVSFDERG